VLIAFWQINKARKPDWELDVVKIRKQTIQELVSASGNISADKYAELTFLASENIKEIVASESAYLNEGDVIAKLNTTSLYQSYLQAYASLRAAQAEVD